jgi:hypothetical protein
MSKAGILHSAHLTLNFVEEQTSIRPFLMTIEQTISSVSRELTYAPIFSPSSFHQKRYKEKQQKAYNRLILFHF